MQNRKTFDVSIIIPAYNTQASISECLSCIVAQSILPSEIIVIDDGSTDSLKNIIHPLISESPVPIKYHYQKNKGAGLARNNGIDKAKSKWIAFLDADDTWQPYKLETQISLIKKHPELEFLSCNYTEWYCDSQNIKHTKVAINPELESEIIIDNYLSLIQKGAFAATPTVMATKSILEKAGGFGPYRVGEDTDLWCRIGMLGVPVLYDNRSMVDVHVDSFRNFTKKLPLPERITQINNLYQLSLEKGKEKEFFPVARILTLETINQLIFQKRQSEVPGFLDALKLPFTKRFILEEKLKANSPRIMGNLIPAYHRIKNIFR